MQVSAVSQASPMLAVARTSGVAAPVTAQQALDAFNSGAAQSNVVITDTKEHIQDNISALLSMGSKLKTINSSNGAMAFTLTADQYAASSKMLQSVFGKVTGTPNATYAVTGMDIDLAGTSLKAALADKRLSSLSVTATAAEVTANFTAMAAAAGKIDKVTVSDPANAIAMTGQQYLDTNAGLLTKIKDGADSAAAIKVSLSGAKVANLVSFNGNSKITALTVKDTAANIAANLATGTGAALNNAKVSTIAQTDGTATIDVSYANYQNTAVAATLKDKVLSNTNVRVTDVTAANALSVVNSDKNVDKVTIKDTLTNVLDNWTAANSAGSTQIEDTAENISARFNDLVTRYGTDGASVGKIKITDSGKITVSKADFDAATTSGMMKKVFSGAGNSPANGFAIVTGVLAADIAATSKLATVANVQVSDTIANAVTNLTNLKALSNSKVNDIQLTGTAAQIGTNFDKLNLIGKNLSTITASDTGDITLSLAQYKAGAFNKIDVTGGAHIKLTNVGAADVKAVAANADITGFTFKDKAANFAGAMTDLIAAEAAGTLTGITMSDQGTMTLTSATYKNAQDVVTMIRAGGGTANTNFGIALTSVAVADLTLASFSGDNFAQVKQVSITDTTEHIEAQINGDLEDLATADKLQRINQSDAAGGRPAIGITNADLHTTAIVKVLDKIYGKDFGGTQTAGQYKLNVTDVTAADAKALFQDAKFGSKVNKMDVVGESAAIGLNLSDLKAVFDAGKLGKITNSNYATAGAVIDINFNQLASYKTMLDKIVDGGGDNNYNLNVKDVTAAAATVTGANSHVYTMTVKDIGASIGGRLAELDALQDGGQLTAITLTDASNIINITGDAYDASSTKALSILNHTDAKPSGDYKLALSAVTITNAADATYAANTDDHVVTYTASAEGADIVANLADLEASTKLQVINRTDGGLDGTENAMELTGAQYADNVTTLNKIQTNGLAGYHAVVSELAADDIARALQDRNVDTFDVLDTAENLGKNILDLQAAQTDSNAQMTAVVQSDPGDIALSFTDYTTAVDVRGGMMSGMTWNVSDVATADLSDVLNDTAVSLVGVKDTATAIADASMLGFTGTEGVLDDAANIDRIDTVTISDNAALALTGAQYTSNITAGTGLLDKFMNANGDDYHAVVTDLDAAHIAVATDDASVDTFAVLDVGSELTTSLSDLMAASAGDKLTAVVVGAQDGSVTDDVTIEIAKDDFLNTDEGNGYVTTDYANLISKTTGDFQIKLTV